MVRRSTCEVAMNDKQYWDESVRLYPNHQLRQMRVFLGYQMGIPPDESITSIEVGKRIAQLRSSGFNFGDLPNG